MMLNVKFYAFNPPKSKYLHLLITASFMRIIGFPFDKFFTDDIPFLSRRLLPQNMLAACLLDVPTFVDPSLLYANKIISQKKYLL